MATSQEKITVYNLADLKNTSDDAIPNYLNSLKFKQSHRLTDVRLALGYAAFAIAGACFAWDYTFGFDDTKYYTAVAVVVYTIINGALTLWIWAVEKGIVYVGTSPSGETVSIATSTRKNVPEYNVTITVQPKSGKSKAQTQTLTRSFTEWFDAAGHFVAPPFQSMLATAIPVVGRLDPKRIASQSSAYSAEVLDALAAAETISAKSTSNDSNTKGSKRRKV